VETPFSMKEAAEQGSGAGRRFTPLALLVVGLIAALVVAVAESAIVATYFNRVTRMTADFSTELLKRELLALAASPGRTVFLGDSVLWGYRLPADENAVAILDERGIAARNLAFKAGSPANYYAVTRLMLAAGIRPRAVVLEINQKTFNQADAAYQTLHPSVASLAYPLLGGADRALLGLSAPPTGLGVRLERTLSSLWLAYALRSDIRDVLYGDGDAPLPDRLSPDLFEGTYDLAPLEAGNVAVHFLRETAATLRRAGIPSLAFMTPTNHALLHEYIDNKQYRANGAYLEALLRRYGVRVVDLDARFASADFLDNDHLTARGQRRLAAELERSLRTVSDAHRLHVANDR
jgi:hypothetical protein